mgnify:CR=1 FL=1
MYEYTGENLFLSDELVFNERHLRQKGKEQKEGELLSISI